MTPDATYTPTRTNGDISGWVIVIREAGADRLARTPGGHLAVFPSRTQARAAAHRLRTEHGAARQADARPSMPAGAP